MDKTIGEVLQELVDLPPESDEWELAGFDREMVADSSLYYQLGRLTKVELDQIRQYLQVKRASSLRKNELVPVLAEAIKIKAPRILEFIDEITYDYLVELVEGKGLLRKADEVFLGTLLYLRQAGLAFAGEMSGVGPVLVMPRELVEMLAPLLKQDATRQGVKDNQRALMAARGLLAHYGLMDSLELEKRLQGIGSPVTDDVFTGLQFGVGLANGYFEMHGPFICDKRVVEREELLQKQQERPDLDYYPLTLKRAIAMGEQLYLDWTEEHRDLFDYLEDDCGLDDDETSEAVAFFLFAVNNRLSATLLLSEWGKIGIEVAEYQQVIDLLTLVEAARKKTRLWALKGHTPDEVEELGRRPKLRVLRSDGKHRTRGQRE